MTSERDDNDALCVSIAPEMLAEEEEADRNGGPEERCQRSQKDFCGCCHFYSALLSRFPLISFILPTI